MSLLKNPAVGPGRATNCDRMGSLVALTGRRISPLFPRKPSSPPPRQTSLRIRRSLTCPSHPNEEAASESLVLPSRSPQFRISVGVRNAFRQSVCSPGTGNESDEAESALLR